MARSKSNVSDPFSTALRLLTRCDRSEAELRRKLRQFGFSVAAIDAAVGKCRSYNYLDDARFATERARSLARSGRGIGLKIRRDLQRRGIAEQHIEQALELVDNEFSAPRLLREQLERRFPDFDYTGADDRQRRRVIGFFQRRGYPLELIFSVLRQPSD